MSQKPRQAVSAGRGPGCCQFRRRLRPITDGFPSCTWDGVPWARIGEHVGQRNLAVTANTYTHVLVDESEIDYATLLVS